MSENLTPTQESSKKLENIESNNKSNNDDNTSQKIIINSINDLYKLPISVMKNTKITNFSGKYFEKLFKKALGLEEKKLPPINMNNSDFISNTKSDQKVVTKKHRKINSTLIGNDKKKKLKLNLLKMNNIPNDFINNNEVDISKIIFQIKYNTKIGEELFILGSNSDLGKWDQKLALKLDWNDNNIWKVSIPFKEGVDEDFEYKFILSCNGRFNWEVGDNRKFVFRNIKQLIEQNNDNKNEIIKVNTNNHSYYYDIKNKTLKIICEWNKK